MLLEPETGCIFVEQLLVGQVSPGKVGLRALVSNTIQKAQSSGITSYQDICAFHAHLGQLMPHFRLISTKNETFQAQIIIRSAVVCWPAEYVYTDFSRKELHLAHHENTVRDLMSGA